MMEEDQLQLSSMQRACVDFSGKNLVIRGVPGSGKTVVLLRRAKRLISQVSLTGAPTVTIFTYNSSLASYASELVGAAGLQGVDVRTFHSWATKTIGAVTGRWMSFVNEQEQVAIIQAALDENRSQLPANLLKRDIIGFWIPEFSWIKGRNIRDAATYHEAVRSGLSTRLLREDRPLVWGVFKEYNRRLFAQGKMDWQDPAPWLLDNLDKIPQRCHIDHVLIDEAQDLTFASLTLLRKVTRQSLTIAADEAQKLYNTAFTWKEMDIEIRGQASKRLKKTFRSTRQIIQLAQGLGTRPADEAEELPDVQGPKPVLYRMHSKMAEKQQVIALATDLHRRFPEETIGIIGVQKNYLYSLASHLPGIPVEKIEKGKQNDWKLTRPGVKLCTAHSAKGLEFDHVIVYRVNEGILPRESTEELDEAAEAEFYMSARRLLYVAMTRARLSLRITCSTPPSRFIGELDEGLMLVRPPK